jgi:hypothetical protein
VYEQRQLELNRTKVTGNLVKFAQPWLVRVSGCSNNNDRFGPKLNENEVSRVQCSLGTVSVYFVEYRTVSDRDKARTRTLTQNVDARTLTPGVAQPTQNPAGLEGNYVEYAYAGSESRTVSGIWWDYTPEPVAGYMIVYWGEGVGQSWEPLRDLWRRYQN